MKQILKQKKLVVLDRDGVINYENPNYIRSPDDWQPIASSLDAIAKLTAAGVKIAVATNQSGIARGYYDRTTLDKIHAKMAHLVEAVGGKIDKIVYCPHHPDAGCNCRKPKTGLLEQISEHYEMDLTDVPFIGDSYKDIGAALGMSCQPILVKTGYGEKSLRELPSDLVVPVYDDLNHAVDALLTEESNEY